MSLRSRRSSHRIRQGRRRSLSLRSRHSSHRIRHGSRRCNRAWRDRQITHRRILDLGKHPVSGWVGEWVGGFDRDGLQD